MMKRLVFLVTAAMAAVVSFGSAYAADLGVKARPAPVAVPVPYYDWTGFYVGVNGGGAWGSQDPFNIITDRFDRFRHNISGGVVGGTVGAQVQVKHVVLGVEADLDWADITGSSVATATVAGVPIAGPFNAQTKIDWESTARLRVGYANDNWLLYSTGGVALLGAKTNLTTVAGGTVCGSGDLIFGHCSATNRQFGAVLGGGLEYAFNPSLSAKLEYLYIAAVSLDVSRHSEIRAGLNYHFVGL